MKKQTKHERMYEAIKKHGQNLNAIFDTALEPVQLCKKLRPLELKAHEIAVKWCNGDGVDSENIDNFINPILAKAQEILGDKYPIKFNGDARGYALKISDKIVRENNLKIYTDWGGYGIIAPDFKE